MIQIIKKYYFCTLEVHYYKFGIAIAYAFTLGFFYKSLEIRIKELKYVE